MSVLDREGVSNLQVSFSGVSNLGHPCPLDTFQVLRELCPFSTLAFCTDKHIAGIIVFYKHISSSLEMLLSL